MTADVWTELDSSIVYFRVGFFCFKHLGKERRNYLPEGNSKEIYFSPYGEPKLWFPIWAHKFGQFHMTTSPLVILC